jgi:UDP-N-acetyl-D-mannosaminuronate dehydrogenase
LLLLGRRSVSFAVTVSDIVVIVYDHLEFKNLDLEKLQRLMRNKVIIDGGRILDLSMAIRNGFKYYGAGLGSTDSWGRLTFMNCFLVHFHN